MVSPASVSDAPEAPAEPSAPRRSLMRRLVFNRRVLATLTAFLVLVTAACAWHLRLPRPTTLTQRLAVFPPADALPLSGTLEIRWNEHQIPYILATHDDDVPLALGLVHAHLRLGQMHLMRRLFTGRLAEVAGRPALPLDATIRSFDVARAVPDIEAALPPETRRWLERFAEGLNIYQQHLGHQRPHEMRLLAMPMEPWTLRDVLTYARGAAIDITWFQILRLAPLMREGAWPEFSERLARYTADSAPSFTVPEALAALGPDALLASHTRTGSNSVVVAGQRSASGAGLIANDPHVGLSSPPLWFVVGIRSPSIQAVGICIPGLPFLALGRNVHYAWGGTNMMGPTSDVLVMDEADARPAGDESIGIRLWPDATLQRRTTDVGPVVSDAPLLRTMAPPGKVLALRWVGHQPSDEITAFLRVMQGESWHDFRTAFETYAVSSQNMLYADHEGNIGQVMAVALPGREPTRNLPVPAPPGEQHHAAWSRLWPSTELPHAHNPPGGALISANNVPVAGADVHVGGQHSSNDRYLRLEELVAEQGVWNLEGLARVQRDVTSPATRRLAHTMAARLNAMTPPPAETAAVRSALEGWDGAYTADSAGAVAATIMAYHLVDTWYRERFGDALAGVLRGSNLYQEFMADDLTPLADGTPPALDDAALAEAARRTARDMQRLPTWGHMHRMQLTHPLGNLPLIGWRYRYGDRPGEGSLTTVMKTGSNLTNRRHRATFGANARHLSDMADPDANFFVLYGGQDGWLRSSTQLDQAPMFLDGRLIRVPMTAEAVEAAFPIVMRFEPSTP